MVIVMSNEIKQGKWKKIVSIIGAWITLPILGITMLWFTTTVGQSVTGALSYEDDNFAGYLILSALSGLLIMSMIIISVWRIRKKAYFFHLLIGLWIGLGLYALIMISGIFSYYENLTKAENSIGCTTSIDQYYKSGSAIVPIETDLGNGTGFIVDSKGTVLTANHVVENATTLQASYASGKVGLTVIAQAPEYDLAILRLERFDGSAFRLSDSYNTGDQVYAYGYPANTFTAGAPTLTNGIISRILTTADLRLTSTDIPDGFELLQTDAAINAGNSGGPLIGSCGAIGVILSVSDSAELSQYVGAVSEQGIGYVVSIKAAVSRFNLILSPNN